MNQSKTKPNTFSWHTEGIEWIVIGFDVTSDWIKKRSETEECQSSVEKLKLNSACYKIQWINQKPNQIHLADTQKVLSELWLVLVSLLIGSERGVQ